MARYEYKGINPLCMNPRLNSKCKFYLRWKLDYFIPIKLSE